jgi:hypothetical protein
VAVAVMILGLGHSDLNIQITYHRALPQIADFDVGAIDEEGASCEAVYPHKVRLFFGKVDEYGHG